MAVSASVSPQKGPWIEHGAPLQWLAILTLIYFAYCYVGMQFSESYPPVTWPAAGAVLAAFGVTRVARWWRVALMAIGVNFLTHWSFGGGDPQAAALVALVRTAEGAIGAWMMKKTVSPPWHRRTGQEILSKMVLSVLVSAGAGALLMIAVDPLLRTSLTSATESFLFWWFSTFTGAVLFSPVFGALILLSIAGRSKVSRIGLFALLYSGVAATLSLLLVSFVDFIPGFSNTYRLVAAGFFLLPPIIWFAARMEPIYVSCLFIVLALITLNGLGDVTTPLGIAYFGDRLATAGVVVYLVACATAAFTRSINAFEKRHAIKLLAARQGAGLLIGKVATMLARPLNGDLQERIESCLRSVGKHAGADRCMIAEFDTERQIVRESNSWVRPGIPPSDALSQELPFAVFKGGVESLLNGSSQFARRRNFPKDTLIGDYLRQIDTRAAGFVPLRSGSDVIGTLGLAWVSQDVTWSNELVATLRSVGEVIGNTVSRFQAEVIAERYRAKLQEFGDNRHRVDELLRREIATDLHDGAAQSLAVARIKLGQCAASNPSSDRSIAEIDGLVASALNEIRGIIDKTGSNILIEFGLAAAVADYLSHASGIAGFKIGLTVDCQTTIPEEERSQFLYRACRELVTNAIKHSQADEISVILLQDNGRYTLRVSDNGKGMSMSHYRPDMAGNVGFGLFSLNEAAASLGARINFSSSDAGTVVAVDVATE